MNEVPVKIVGLVGEMWLWLWPWQACCGGGGRAVGVALWLWRSVAVAVAVVAVSHPRNYHPGARICSFGSGCDSAQREHRCALTYSRESVVHAMVLDSRPSFFCIRVQPLPNNASCWPKGKLRPIPFVQLVWYAGRGDCWNWAAGLVGLAGKIASLRLGCLLPDATSLPRRQGFQLHRMDSTPTLSRLERQPD